MAFVHENIFAKKPALGQTNITSESASLPNASTTYSTYDPVDNWESYIYYNPISQILGLDKGRSEENTYKRQMQLDTNNYIRELQKLDIQNAFNATEAQKNREFQERLSNTQYQRAVKDLKNAGLNPVLALSHNMGSVPSGNVAQSGSGGVSSGSKAQGNNSNIAGALLNVIAGVLKLLK